MITFDKKGVGEALHQGGLTIPKYQREYKWRAENASEFFSDVEDAIDRNKADYFVGSIVVAKQASKAPEIVDGQQRLATTAILFSAVRDYFFQIGSKEDALDIQRDYLLVKDRRSGEAIPKLTLSGRDHDFFKKAILDPPDSPDRNIVASTPSHERLRAVQEVAKKYVKTITDGFRDPNQRLEDRIEYFKSQVSVIWVGAADDADAFRIFETLNDRGLDLATTDLVKNFLFGRAEKRIDEVQNSWISMYARLESCLSKEEQITDFLRHQWSSRYGLTRDKDLFTEIKSKTSTVSKAVTYATELESDSKLYEAIVSNSQPFWSDWGGTAKKDIRVINDLKMERIRPLLLAMLASFKREEAKKALHLFVSWGVRLLVAPSVAGTLERFYSDTAKKVRAGSIKKARELVTASKGIVPLDDDFRTYFAKTDVNNSKVARYLLQELEFSRNPGFQIRENGEEVNLEHILPQNCEPLDWAKFDPDLLDHYINKLGNLCLLLETENRKLKNEKFATKKTIYANSKFTLTAMVARGPEWDSAAISKRQEELAGYAVKIWKNAV